MAQLKTAHYVTLTADGYVVEANESEGVPPSVLKHLMGLVSAYGNIVVGRRTYEVLFRQVPMSAIPGRVIVLSQTLNPVADVHVVSSPDQAWRVLGDLNLSTALVAGGPATYGAFLDRGALDELHLNIAPVATGGGLRMAWSQTQPVALELVSADRLDGGIAQMLYRRGA